MNSWRNDDELGVAECARISSLNPNGRGGSSLLKWHTRYLYVSSSLPSPSPCCLRCPLTSPLFLSSPLLPFRSTSMMDNARPPRPPITRGASAPLYQRRQLSSQDDDSMRLQGIAGLSRIDEVASRQFNGPLFLLPTSPLTANLTDCPFPHSPSIHVVHAFTGLATSDSIRRTLGASEVTSTTSSRPMPSPATTAASATQGLFTPPQTPYSSMTSTTTRGGATPRIMSPADVPAQTYFPMPATVQQSFLPMAPSVSATPSSSSSNFTPTQLLRQSPQAEIKMEIESSRTLHTLLAPLGNKFSSDSITIAAKKNNVLQIMADRWDQEADSKFKLSLSSFLPPK